jgi:biotin transporter BioY
MSLIKEIWHEYSTWAYNSPFEAVWMTLLAICMTMLACGVIGLLFYIFPIPFIVMSALLGVVMFIVWMGYRSHAKRHPE